MSVFGESRQVGGAKAILGKLPATEILSAAGGGGGWSRRRQGQV